jgi:tripartite-type tricarboxylate transporter receptor subunit TctC
VRHIPYRGATQATTDVVGGQVPMMFSGLSVAAPFIKDGKLRALAVLGPNRSSLLPDVPTMVEAGIAGFTFDTWVGLYAPKGTPAPIIAQLNAEVGKSLADPKVLQRLVALGFEPRHSTPAELGARTRDGLQRVSKVIRDAGIKAD